MINKKDFELIPYHNDATNSKKENVSNKIIINEIKEKIIKIVDYSNSILIHECNKFEEFSGRDIDAFYVSNQKFLDIGYDNNLLFFQRKKGSHRYLINDLNSSNFFNLDIEDLKTFSPKTNKLNKFNFQNAVKCEKTKLRHFRLDAIVFYKIVKYFSHGLVFSYHQLYELKKILSSINEADLKNILSLTSNNLPEEYFFIKKLIEDEFINFENDSYVKRFFINKRIVRQNKRKVFNGKLKLKNLFKSKRFLKAFLFGSFAKWPQNHNPMPAIAIIGNDGAGKTSICEKAIQNFHKMEPAHINMKSSEPIIKFTKYINKFIKKLLDFKIINKISLLRMILSFVGQSFYIIDQYIKYRIGMAFADSGNGITIFERYITDKLRGEFPNKKNKFLPLEQYFPLPDGFFYLDVSPEISIERKVNDKHTISEMTSKRSNYISLLKEFDEVKIIPCDNKLEDNLKDLKNYIFELAIKKKNKLNSNKGEKRCIWKKNRNRVLSGDPRERFQKGSFL